MSVVRARRAQWQKKAIVFTVAWARVSSLAYRPPTTELSGIRFFSCFPNPPEEQEKMDPKKESHISDRMANEANSSAKGGDTISTGSRTPESSVSTSQGIEAPKALPTNPSSLTQLPDTISTPTESTTAAGPAVASAQSEVPLSPALRPTFGTASMQSIHGSAVQYPTPSGCVVGVEALETPTVVPDSTAPGQSLTMKFVMTTKCTSTTLLAPFPFPDPSMVKPPDFTQMGTTLATAVLTLTSTSAVISLMPLPAPTTENTTATTATTLATTVIAPTIVTVSPSATPFPGKHLLSPTQTGLVVTSGILGLLSLMALAFFIRRCLRKRKEDKHGKISSFWCEMFHPSHPGDPEIAQSDLPRAPGLAPCTRITSNPAPPSTPNNQPNPFSAFKAAASSKTPSASFKRFPNPFNARDREGREAERGRAQAERKAAEIDQESVDICLDEDLALEEQERLEIRQEVAQWDAARKSLSPFPKPPPKPAP